MRPGGRCLRTRSRAHRAPRGRAGCARRRRAGSAFALRLRPVELAELGPPRSPPRLRRRVHALDAEPAITAPPWRCAPSAIGSRVHLGACEQSCEQEQRLAVVGAGLEQPEQRDLVLRKARRSSFPTRRFWSSFTSMTALRSWKLPRVRRKLLERERVLRKTGSAEADARARNAGPMRRSNPMPCAPVTTSAPVASQTFAISLMNEIRVTTALAASLIISADDTSHRTTGASIPSSSRSTTSPSAESNAPTTIRSGA